MTAFLAFIIQYAPTILSLLPSIITFVEQTMGGAPSADKHAAAVGLIAAIAPELEAHLTSDPAKAALLDKLIHAGVDYMNKSGNMPTKATTIAVPATPQAGAPIVDQG